MRASRSEYRITARGENFPLAGQGTSRFDPDWNALDAVSGVRLLVDTNSVDWDNTTVEIRVPDIQRDGTHPDMLGGTNGIVSWGFFASDRFVTADEESNMVSADTIRTAGTVTLGPLIGKTNASDNPTSIADTATTVDCSVPPFCILRLFTIRGLFADIADTPTPFPYLEWRMSVNGAGIPLPEALIETRGQYRGYLRTALYRIPQRASAGVTNITVYQ